MAAAHSFVYSAINKAGDTVVAIGHEGIDPATDKLYWFPLPEGFTVDDYLTHIGYERARLRPHPSINTVDPSGKVTRLRMGKTAALPTSVLVSAKDAAEHAMCDINTFRVYARRGHAPKPYESGKRPQWVEQEVIWWATHRKGQGNRTDKTAPELVAVPTD